VQETLDQADENEDQVDENEDQDVKEDLVN